MFAYRLVNVVCDRSVSRLVTTGYGNLAFSCRTKRRAGNVSLTNSVPVSAYAVKGYISFNIRLIVARRLLLEA